MFVPSTSHSFGLFLTTISQCIDRSRICISNRILGPGLLKAGTLDWYQLNVYPYSVAELSSRGK